MSALKISKHVAEILAVLAFATTVNAQSEMSDTDGGEATSHDMATMDAEPGDHDHPALPVDPALPIPSLTHLVFPDAMDGYNVQILSRNFTFTPAAINRENVANEGHAHIYVNGVKYARIYGNWFHLPSAALFPGVNAVTVTLNANDHSTWALPEGELIASTVAVIRPSVGE
jgi:hypothetical protein